MGGSDAGSRYWGQTPRTSTEQGSELVGMPGRGAPVAIGVMFSGPKMGPNLRNDQLPFTHLTYVHTYINGLKALGSFQQYVT